MRKTFLVGFRAVIATGIFSVIASISTPVLPQEAETESLVEDSPVFVEATIVGDADPATATTVEDLEIPVEELKLMIKPLTLEELQTEAAAWFFILKAKVQEISDTEIAIRREKRVVKLQSDASVAISEAESQLVEAEAELEAAEPGTDDYEQAAKQVEEAKESLREAQQLLEEAIEATQELQENEALEAVIEGAATEGAAETAKSMLEQAKTARDDLEAGSDEYNKATETIDNLDQALTELDDLKEELDALLPESAEYQETEAKIEPVQTTIDTTIDALMQSGLIEQDGDEQDDDAQGDSEENTASLEDMVADIEEAEDVADLEAIEAPDPEAELEAEPSEASPETESTTESLSEAADQLDAFAEEETELKNQLLVNVTELQGDQASIVDRFKVILDELDRKGGDSNSYRSYIDAATAFEIDVTDTSGLGVRVWSWLKSEEGGLRWTISLFKFASIVLVSVGLSRVTSSVTRRGLSKIDGISTLLQGVLVKNVKRGTIVLGCLIALTSLGVSLAPLLALFGGLSFIVAFALQDNLGNFASGLMLLFYKPFDIGDFVVIPDLGQRGYVRKITLASTSFDHYNGKIVTVPNSVVWASNIENLAPGEDCLIEFVFLIDSNDDTAKIQKCWEQAINQSPGINREKWHMSLPWISPSSGGLYYWCGAWANKEGFWEVYTGVYDTMMQELRKAGITLGEVKNENSEYLPDNFTFSPARPPRDSQGIMPTPAALSSSTSAANSGSQTSGMDKS